MNNQDKSIDIIANSLDDFEKVCAITISLRIVDGSCKMNDYEKSVFMALYDAIIDKKTDFFEDSVCELISLALDTPSEKVYVETKKLSSSAMGMITLPRMKAFKDGFRKQLS
ncbi:MAG: hypothetical protein ACI9TV_001105 [Sulfurimonas sp.]|jgi:hypothetical protein|uniref:hypothetical protein n=1 Tax=Sulfurimonas sp. TaxID=2022749 RepID=UPI0039E2ED8C